MKNELLPQTSSEEDASPQDKKFQSVKTFAEDETELVPLVLQNQKKPDGVQITEKEYKAYRKKLAKETLRKLKYPNGKNVDEIGSYKFDVLSKLGNRAANLNFDIAQLEPKK